MKTIKQKTWVSPKVKFSKSPLGGKGMFAISDINIGEKVISWGGIYTDKSTALKAKKQGKLVMQVDVNLYSVEDRGEDDSYFINHSCDSNLWMKDARTLIARKDIESGEELTADYALWEADESFIPSWSCACKSPLCRGRFTGKDWRNKDIQKRYKDHFLPLINKRIANS